MISILITPQHLQNLARILAKSPERPELVGSIMVQVVADCWIRPDQAVAILEAWWELPEVDRMLLSGDEKILQVWIINRMSLL